MSRTKRINKILQDFAIPLIFGVIFGIVWANTNHHSYEVFLDKNLIPGFKLFGHNVTFHFLVNDIFMVFFFGLAAMEITVSFLPGGSLNPIKKAINPLFGTLGGVLGPIGIFFLLTQILNLDSLLSQNTMQNIYKGWGIPTATDIAIAWLVARTIFGKGHPAISFLLLLAIADDAIGLVIIAVFYPSPDFPVEPTFLLINVFSIIIARILRSNDVKRMWVYLLLAGFPSWIGLIMAHIHPALALVPIVPFLPSRKHNIHHSPPLYQFEHFFKYPVDIGLFLFGVANAGVSFSVLNQITWIILSSLIVGKTIGVLFFSTIATYLKFPLPDKVSLKLLPIIGMIAGIGLTVALFVSGEAYSSPELQGAAKMGAFFSIVAAPIAWLLSKILKVKKIN